MAGDALLNGYSFRLVARLGNAASVPTLKPGEVGWDVDKKVARYGDDTSTPPRVPTDKSLGDFNMSSSGVWTFSEVAMVPGGTVDGVDVSLLNVANGIMVRKANNSFGVASIISSDNSILVVNGDGTVGNIDVRISPAIMALINQGGYLTEIVASSRFTGNGTAATPLEIKDASTIQVGAVRLATPEEADAGELNNVALTPYDLMTLDADSTVINYLKSLFQTTLSISTDTTLTGNGNSGSPLSVVQASTTQRGAATAATQVEANAGTSAQDFITPATLKSLAGGSDTIIQLAQTLGISLPLNVTSLSMTGPGLLGRTTGGANQPVQVVPYSSRAKVIQGSTANDMDVVNQGTLKTFFPSGLAKTEPTAYASLPTASTAGKGAIAYDDTVGGLKVSDGAAWRGVEAYSPYQTLWKIISSTTYSGTGIVTINLLPTERLQIITTAPSDKTLKIQANINGTWVTCTDTPQVADNEVVWLVRPDGANLMIFYNSYDPVESGYVAGFGLIYLHTMGLWNGQIRGIASNVTYKAVRFRPYAVDVSS